MSDNDELFRDDEMEHALLGAVVATPSHLPMVEPRVVNDDMGLPAHWHAWAAVLTIHRSRQPLTLATLRSQLRRDGQLNAVEGKINLAALPHMVVTLAQCEEYARRVNENGVARRTLTASQRVTLAAKGAPSPSEFVATASTLMREAATTTDALEYVDLGTIALEYDASIEEAMRRGGMIEGSTTGLFDLDQVTAGMRDGQLIIIAARPAMGKSALAAVIATNCANLERDEHDRYTHRVAVFSLEMTRREWWERMVCEKANVDSQRIRRREHTPEEWARMVVASEYLSHLPVEIYERGGLTIAEIRAACLRIKSTRGLRLVVIDYLGLVKITTNENRGDSAEQRTGDACRQCKELAKELGCPVVLLAQLNRKCEERPDKRPMQSDLRDSGQIEQHADGIWFVYRDDVYDFKSPWKGIAEVIVAKQRGGETGVVRVAYEKTYTRFRGLTDAEKERCEALEAVPKTGPSPRARGRRPTPYEQRTAPTQEHADAAE